MLQFHYRFAEVGGHGGLLIGGGVVHTGERPISTAVGAQLFPSYETYNLNLNYAIREDFHIALAVTNVFDEGAVLANSGILFRPLDPRMMKLTVIKSW